MTIEHNGKTLFLSQNIELSFKYNIRKAVSFDTLVVVLLEVPSGTVFNENIFGVSHYGKILWQIEKSIPGGADSPYIDIKESSHGLDAYNWSGIRVRVSLDDGVILDKRVTK